MTITEIKYGYTFNRGDYQAERIDVSASLLESEDPATVLESLKRFVHDGHSMKQLPLVPQDQSPAVSEEPAAAKKRKPRTSPEAKEAAKEERLKEEAKVINKEYVEAKKSAPYDRKLDVHKKFFGEMLLKFDPNWKTSGLDRAKKISEEMQGIPFLDHEGLVLESFREEMAKKFA